MPDAYAAVVYGISTGGDCVGKRQSGPVRSTSGQAL